MELTDELCRYYNDFVSPKNLVFEIKKNSAGLVAVNDNVPTCTALSFFILHKGRSLSISCGDHNQKRVD